MEYVGKAKCVVASAAWLIIRGSCKDFGVWQHLGLEREKEILPGQLLDNLRLSVKVGEGGGSLDLFSERFHFYIHSEVRTKIKPMVKLKNLIQNCGKSVTYVKNRAL